MGVARLKVLALVLLALPAGCGDEPSDPSPPSVKPSRTIRASSDPLAILPGGSKMVDFTLLDEHGQGVARRVLTFTITGMGHGALLSADRAVTDDRGRVRIQVISGAEAIFHVLVTAPRAADLLLPVFVDLKTRGPVEVVPRLQGAADVVATVSSIRLYLLTGSKCADINRARPMVGAIPPRVIDPGSSSMFDSVSGTMEDTHAIVGHGLDAAEIVKLDGCIDLPGGSVLKDDPIRLVLPLQPLRPSVAGRFRAVTVVPLDRGPKAATVVVTAWSQLAACPGDPGRLWLDCTVDALGLETPNDPLDCVPSAMDEAAFDGRLAARRGLPAMDQPQSRCRQRNDGAGRASLETQIEGMFAAASPPISEVMAVPADVANLLRSFRLQSTLELSRTTNPTRFLADHQLEVLELGETSPIAQPLWELGLPLRAARFIPTTAEAGEISFARHGFTLRLGTAARLALERGILARRGFPPDIAAFVSALFASARYSDRGTPLQGCAALSALVCPLVTGPMGCMTSACTAGGAALGRRLTNVFAGLDGVDLDLNIEGFAPIIDREGDGVADAFGSSRPTSPSGSWAGYLRTADEQHLILGSFTADRER